MEMEKTQSVARIGATTIVLGNFLDNWKFLDWWDCFIIALVTFGAFASGDFDDNFYMLVNILFP